MDMVNYFQMLARYNRIANQRLFEQCAELDDAEYRKPRAGSFNSIHGLLNHLLLSDRIWMARFEGRGHTTPPLSTILFDDFAALRAARAEMDNDIECFFERLDAAALARPIRYRNSQGMEYAENPQVAMGHFFNHQTHHRGQIHVMLSQTPAGPPSLDLHRIVNP